MSLKEKRYFGIWFVSIFLAAGVFAGIFAAAKYLPRTMSHTAVHGQESAHGASTPGSEGKHADAPVGHAKASEQQPSSHDSLPHWTYNGESGPDYWGSLVETYAACSAGQEQSPIDIDPKRAKPGYPKLAFAYHAAKGTVQNNGHTIQVDLAGPTQSMTIGRDAFQLVQFHFHLPSEHRIDGEGAPMEVHFVHKNAKGQLAVVGVLLRLGVPNDLVENVWQMAPQEAGAKSAAIDIDPNELLPKNHQLIAYAGSLTTPPCSEHVRWHVLNEGMPIGPEQLQFFKKLFPLNARPIQGLNGRRLQTQ